MRGGDFFSHLTAGMFWLILVGLVLKNWQGANAGLQTTFAGTNTLVNTLEHP